MEKRNPHYTLSKIQAQMTSIDEMNMTESSRKGARLAGMKMADAMSVIQSLSSNQFYKSMTTHQDHRIWQDVYHGEWCNKPLYIKFQQAGEYFVVSFKEL